MEEGGTSWSSRQYNFMYIYAYPAPTMNLSCVHSSALVTSVMQYIDQCMCVQSKLAMDNIERPWGVSMMVQPSRGVSMMCGACTTHA